MVDEDLYSCDMFIFVDDKRKEHRQSKFAWSRNIHRSEQRSRNYTHKSKDEIEHKTVLACNCHVMLYCRPSSIVSTVYNSD